MTIKPIGVFRGLPVDHTVRAVADPAELEALAPSADLRLLHRHPVTAAQRVATLLPGLAVTGGAVAAGFGIHTVMPSASPLVVCLVIGALLANLGLLPDAARSGTHYAAKRLL